MCREPQSQRLNYSHGVLSIKGFPFDTIKDVGVITSPVNFQEAAEIYNQLTHESLDGVWIALKVTEKDGRLTWSQYAPSELSKKEKPDWQIVVSVLAAAVVLFATILLVVFYRLKRQNQNDEAPMVPQVNEGDSNRPSRPELLVHQMSYKSEIMRTQQLHFEDGDNPEVKESAVEFNESQSVDDQTETMRPLPVTVDFKIEFSQPANTQLENSPQNYNKTQD